MVNPKKLLDCVVAQLQSIPTLTGVEINGYDAQSGIYTCLDQALDNLNNPGVLVIWKGCVAPRRGENRGWRHALELVVRAPDEIGAFDICQLIVDGIPTPPAGNDCFTFLESCPSDDFDPITDLDVQFATDKDGIEFLRIAYIATEKQ
jgi:hypothetical protein